MSSQGSPRLELDLHGRRWEHRVAWLAVIVAPVSLLWTFSWTIAVLLALVAAYGFLRAGWLGKRNRIERAVWSPDGRWMLTDARGRLFEGTLREDTRVGGRVVWLRWNANRTRSMLLLPDDVASADLRRLIVRLRIERERAFQEAQGR